MYCRGGWLERKNNRTFCFAILLPFTCLCRSAEPRFASFRSRCKINTNIPDHVQCPHCQRKFDKNAAQRHIPICVSASGDSHWFFLFTNACMYSPAFLCEGKGFEQTQTAQSQNVVMEEKATRTNSLSVSSKERILFTGLVDWWIDWTSTQFIYS